jgi:undecaprenyl-diphosphatase
MTFPISLEKLDQKWALAINSFGGQMRLLDALGMAVSSSNLWIVVGVVVIGFLLRSGRTKILSTILLGLIALGLADLISFELIKPFFARERPCWTLAGIYQVQGFCGGSYGFTSNHAANAAAFVTTLFLSRYFTVQVLSIAVAVVVLIGLSRVFLGVHYPGDVAGGYLLGFTVARTVRVMKLQFVTDKLAVGLTRLYEKVRILY